jgi:hypothetical protein
VKIRVIRVNQLQQFQKLNCLLKLFLFSESLSFYFFYIHEFSQVFRSHHKAKKQSVKIRAIRVNQLQQFQKLNCLLKLFLFSVLLHYQKECFVEFKKTS